MQSTCVQNLMILASAVPEISLGAQKFKMGHHASMFMMGLDMPYVCMCTNFDVSCISHSTDIVSAHQILYGSRDLTTPFSEMVSLSSEG